MSAGNITRKYCLTAFPFVWSGYFLGKYEEICGINHCAPFSLAPLCSPPTEKWSDARNMKAFFLAVHRYGNLETEAGLALTLDKLHFKGWGYETFKRKFKRWQMTEKNKDFLHEKGFSNWDALFTFIWPLSNYQVVYLKLSSQSNPTPHTGWGWGMFSLLCSQWAIILSKHLCAFITWLFWTLCTLQTWPYCHYHLKTWQYVA